MAYRNIVAKISRLSQSNWPDSTSYLSHPTTIGLTPAGFVAPRTFTGLLGLLLAIFSPKRRDRDRIIVRSYREPNHRFSRHILPLWPSGSRFNVDKTYGGKHVTMCFSSSPLAGSSAPPQRMHDPPDTVDDSRLQTKDSLVDKMRHEVNMTRRMTGTLSYISFVRTSQGASTHRYVADVSNATYSERFFAESGQSVR
jgi:hypothetical protein